MTAAHRSLPFGTRVHVTGPRGSVVVRINDRGPFVKGRCIDLSYGAASCHRDCRRRPRDLLMCWLAKGLIAVCVGYLPSPGETVTVKRACISNYSKLTRGAASACAHEHKIKYRVEQ
jgi:hypothetical protein